MPEIDGYDEQDQSEVFDETHLDDEGDLEAVFELTPDVMDMTHLPEDDADDLDDEDALSAEGVEPEADDGFLSEQPEGTMSGDPDLDDLGAYPREVAARPSEIELTYVGSVEDMKGAQSSAAHWETRRELSDDDLQSLGYVDDEGETQ
ncbi:hypothetical protein Q0812_02970 [Brevundimonas sp. 2R-24]|uniref:Uncharacterized protein n=1 Tax=Peiella sedimenti TaxID=3061083 RepID=A0ABT8SIJ2_9CAUL|nr:hypothetical protein [Caulobacteraceae bacterium XZ-24]